MIDLRSDTVTKPTEEMRQAMAAAPVGDDVFGDDPTVNQLEERVAEILGKEAAIYGPSGTMTNQIGVYVHTTGRGDGIILHEEAHIFFYEGGAPAILSSVQTHTLPAENGILSPEAIRSSIQEENVHHPRQKLLCLENTHNRAGGKVYPLQDFAAAAETGRELGLKVHLDGARLFNAVVTTGVSAREWCEHVDTVSVCSSKGLGAPVGSLLAGDAETIREARRARKIFGGGMRQAGIIAAASLYGFENNVERLAEDHRRAQRLADGLREADFMVEPPETNIVMVDSENPGSLQESLARAGVLATMGRAGAIRLCTHLDVSDEDIEAVIHAASQITTEAL